MSKVTKYILLVPSCYVVYCIYENYQYQANKLALAKARESESIKSLTSRFNTCKSSIELTNIFKKSFHYLRGSIVEPTRTSQEVVDCEVLQSGQGSSSWLYPYSTRNKISLTPYLNVQNKKQGYYSIFFWYNVQTKQSLHLQDTQTEVEAIGNFLKRREKKCMEIAKRYDSTGGEDFENHFSDCIRRSQGVTRVVEKELNRIKIMQYHNSLFKP